jgi:hypothetical protein
MAIFYSFLLVYQRVYWGYHLDMFFFFQKVMGPQVITGFNTKSWSSMTYDDLGVVPF